MISKVSQKFNSMALAAKEGKYLMSIPLKDKSTAKVLWNENAIDCYIVQKGKIKEAMKVRGPEDFWIKEMASLLTKLEERVVDGIDITRAFAKSWKNVK